MKLDLYLTKDYENEPRLCPPAKQTQSKPIYARADRTNKYLFLASQRFTSGKAYGNPPEFENITH